MKFRCIGQYRQKNGNLIQCDMESDTATWREIYLCSECANSRQNKIEKPPDSVELNGMQLEPREYRDQMEQGFLSGINEGGFDEETDW